MSEVTKEDWHRIMKEELFDFAPQTLIEKYSWQISKILNAFEEINDDFGSALLTDKARFVDFEPIGLGDEELEKLSKILDIKINYSDKIVEIAKKMFDRK